MKTKKAVENPLANVGFLEIRKELKKRQNAQKALLNRRKRYLAKIKEIDAKLKSK